MSYARLAAWPRSWSSATGTALLAGSPWSRFSSASLAEGVLFVHSALLSGGSRDKPAPVIGVETDRLAGQWNERMITVAGGRRDLAEYMRAQTGRPAAKLFLGR